MLDFLSLMMALVALIVARKAFNQVGVLRARLESMEATPLQARPGPPPLPPRGAAGAPRAGLARARSTLIRLTALTRLTALRILTR